MWSKLSSDRKHPPGVEHGSVLEVALLVHQQHVSVLALAAAEEGPMQHLHFHLGLRQLPGGGGDQQRREEAAERGHQHAAAPLPAVRGETPAGRDGWSLSGEAARSCDGFDVATFITVSETHPIGCCLLANKPRPQTGAFSRWCTIPQLFFLIYCLSGTYYIHA